MQIENAKKKKMSGELICALKSKTIIEKNVYFIVYIPSKDC